MIKLIFIVVCFSGCAIAAPLAFGLGADLLLCESLRQYHKSQGCPEGCYAAGEQCPLPFKSPAE